MDSLDKLYYDIFKIMRFDLTTTYIILRVNIRTKC